MNIPEPLEEIADEIQETGEPKRVTVREMLSWFDQQRRGRQVTSRIRSAFRKLEVTTFPDFETAFIDGKVELRPLEKNSESGSKRQEEANASDDDDVSAHSDPVARIRMLRAANQKPVSVSENDTVADAVTEMLINDYSQLPVMAGERSVSGMISWRSIGRAQSLNRQCERVKDCMEKAETIPADMPLLRAIHHIVENEVVLVRETDRTISGLVTTSDISLQFQELAEPFLLVGEIENHLRRLIDQALSSQELSNAKNPEDSNRQVNGVEDLTFGEYIRLLESNSNWQRLKINLDRVRVIKRLHQVREIRNDVMHFSPDGIGPNERELLRDSVRFMQRL